MRRRRSDDGGKSPGRPGGIAQVVALAALALLAAVAVACGGRHGAAGAAAGQGATVASAAADPAIVEWRRLLAPACAGCEPQEGAPVAGLAALPPRQVAQGPGAVAPAPTPTPEASHGQRPAPGPAQAQPPAAAQKPAVGRQQPPGPAPAPGVAPAQAPAQAGVEERVSISLGGLWLGPVGGARTHYLFVRRRRTEELAQFAHLYAPFRVATAGEGGGGGDLEFHGHGAQVASAAERRMITEWTRAVVVELGAGSGASPFGLALAWHRAEATGGARCDELAVFLSGDVRAGPCGGAEAHGRLSGERLGRLYAWLDSLQPFQDSGEQVVSDDAFLARLVFAGRGQHPASSAEIASMAAFAETLQHELVAAAATAAVAAPGAGAAGIAAAAQGATRAGALAPGAASSGTPGTGAAAKGGPAGAAGAAGTPGSPGTSGSAGPGGAATGPGSPVDSPYGAAPGDASDLHLAARAPAVPPPPPSPPRAPGAAAVSGAPAADASRDADADAAQNEPPPPPPL